VQLFVPPLVGRLRQYDVRQQAITADNAYAVATNRTAGRVTIFKLDLS